MNYTNKRKTKKSDFCFNGFALIAMLGALFAPLVKADPQPTEITFAGPGVHQIKTQPDDDSEILSGTGDDGGLSYGGGARIRIQGAFNK